MLQLENTEIESGLCNARFNLKVFQRRLLDEQCGQPLRNSSFIIQ